MHCARQPEAKTMTLIVVGRWLVIAVIVEAEGKAEAEVRVERAE